MDLLASLPWTRVGPYRLLCELGRGSMAVVYLGRLEGPGGFERLCALKMIHSNLSESSEFVGLFLNEARIAARIHHPNVIAVDDISTHEGRYYLRMDYVSGETLFQALDRTWNTGAPFPLNLGAQIIAAAAEGLHAAHELQDARGAPLGVIHRDLGPHNILLGYDGVVRVMDFGIAKALDQLILTQPGTWRGTAAFMSPEQVRGEPLDRRANIFSLGVVLWEMTVGARLFKHSTMAGTMARIQSLEIPAPSSLRPDYPPALEAVVMAALERDRERRTPTAQALSEALIAHLVEQGVAPSTGSLARFMEEHFAERRQERLEMEQAARQHDHSGTMKTALRPARADDLSSIEEAPSLARASLLRPASLQARAATAMDPSEAPTGVEPKQARRGSKIELRAQPRDLWTFALVISMAAAAAIGVTVGLGRHPTAEEAAPMAMVRLSFVLSPAEAEVHVDGRPQRGELVVPLSPQQYTVEVSAPGYQAKTLIVSAEATRAIEVQLAPSPKPGSEVKRPRPRRGHRKGR